MLSTNHFPLLCRQILVSQELRETVAAIRNGVPHRHKGHRACVAGAGLARFATAASRLVVAQ